jgi:hypothetical protein
LGHTALDSDIDGRSRAITDARMNYLVKRWNLERAQANICLHSASPSPSCCRH